LNNQLRTIAERVGCFTAILTTIEISRKLSCGKAKGREEGSNEEVEKLHGVGVESQKVDLL
jgi:hypothetical protein